MTPPAGRKRSHGKEWIPPYVECDKYGYRYNNKSTKECIRLKRTNGSILRTDASKAEVWAAYDGLSSTQEYIFNTVIDKYFLSPQFKELRGQTQKDYQQYATRIRSAFGVMHPDTITTHHVRLFMDARGETYPTAANHEKAFLSIVVNWGRERGYVTITNPCIGIRNFKSKSAGKNTSDADYLGLYNLCIEHGHVMHAATMEIAYLCGSRQQDVLRIYDTKPIRPKEYDCYVTKEGIVIWQRKTGKVQLKRWTTRLKAAVELARKHKAKSKKKISSPWLICTRSGTRFTRSGFNASWGRMQRLATESGFERFRFHDTKHKGITDFDGDKQEFSGHATRAMVNHYDHGIDEVDTVNKPMNIDK